MGSTTFLRTRKEYCKKLIAKLNDKYSYASILGVDSQGFNIRLDKFNTSISDSDECERGFVVKVYDGKGYLEYSFNDLNADNIDEIAEKICNFEIKENKRVEAKMLEDEPMVKEFSRNDEKPMTIEEIISSLSKVKDECLARDEHIINAAAIYDGFTITKMFITKNKDLEQQYHWCNSYINVVSRRESTIKAARYVAGSVNTKDAVEELTSKIAETCDLSIALLDSLQIIPGEYDVITDPSITGLIAHEAFGHGVELDMVVKNRAKSKDYMNEYVASSIVSMHDGALAGLSVASYFFDDDGVLAHDTEIIRDGVLVAGMSDALSAMQLNQEPTGNGRRQSFTHKAYTRMTNTFFVPGTDKVEDMIKSIDYGFYLCDTNNGMEDPKNWQIQCVCEYAREIKDGKFTGRIFSPVILSGYVLDLLKSITMVSDAFKLEGSGFCGKGYKEWVRVSDGGPHLKARVKLG